jgi:hypothetical protein
MAITVAVMSKYAFLKPIDDTAGGINEPGNYKPFKKYFAPGTNRKKQSFGIQFAGFVGNFYHNFNFEFFSRMSLSLSSSDMEQPDNYSYRVVYPMSPLGGLISATGSPRHTDFVNHLGYIPFDGGKRPHALVNPFVGLKPGRMPGRFHYMEEVVVKTICALQTPLLTCSESNVVWADKSLHEYYVRNNALGLQAALSLLTIIKSLAYTMAFVITAMPDPSFWSDALVAATTLGITLDPRSPRTWPTPEFCHVDIGYANPCASEWLQQWQYVRDYDVRVVIHQAGNIASHWFTVLWTSEPWDFWFKMLYVGFNLGGDFQCPGWAWADIIYLVRI